MAQASYNFLYVFVTISILYAIFSVIFFFLYYDTLLHWYYWYCFTSTITIKILVFSLYLYIMYPILLSYRFIHTYFLHPLIWFLDYHSMFPNLNIGVFMPQVPFFTNNIALCLCVISMIDLMNNLKLEEVDFFSFLSWMRFCLIFVVHKKNFFLRNNSHNNSLKFDHIHKFCLYLISYTGWP